MSLDEQDFSLGLLAGISMNECVKINYNPNLIAKGINASLQKAKSLNMPLSFSKLFEKQVTAEWRDHDLIELKGELLIRFSSKMDAKHIILRRDHLYTSRAEGNMLVDHFKQVGESFLNAYYDPTRLEDIGKDHFANPYIKLQEDYFGEDIHLA